MGILDDAIREHLDLKRSHGANEDEIRRKEAEVFGQPRPETGSAEPAEAALDEHTQAVSPDERADAEGTEPGAPADRDVPPAAEAGAGTLEPSDIETGPPIPPSHHHDEQHPALADHDHISREEHAPDPVFGRAAETPTAPPDTPLDPPPVDDPPVGDPPVA